MNNTPVVSFVLHGHAPFIRHPDQVFPSQERWLFESISETYIPLLEVFERLDRDHVSFRMGLSLSPTLCHMLTDEVLIARYLDYVDRQIEFGLMELDRSARDSALHVLARHFYDRVIEKKAAFTEQYGKNLLKGFDYYQKKGRIEIITTAATHAFLPFFASCPEAVQAEFEVGIASHRLNFGRHPHGFWLPELGWDEDIDSWLRSYNFSYTILDSHSLAFASPCAEKGNFYPARTPQGIFVFGRDFYAAGEIAEISGDPVFMHNRRDPGYELSPEMVKPFLGPKYERGGTGYKYWARGENGEGKALYNMDEAAVIAGEKAKKFLDSAGSRLRTASGLMDVLPVSFCAFEADSFGRFWHEGVDFIETMFREANKSGEIQFLTPSEYLCRLDSGSFQTLKPEFSSWGINGYAETWLDASNDWMYRHATRALERMVEIAERFPNNTGLKERALNQAAREILLALSSDWPKMLYKQESAEYAKSRIEGSLRNFTTIYEALGSNYISTEWLTHLEKKHNIFPNINYRVFRRKN